jgi:hypothetical protein
MLRRTVYALTFGLVVLLIADWEYSSSLPCHSAQTQQEQNQASEEYCRVPHGPVASPFIWIAGILEHHGEAVTALFTVVLAISTILLWASTRDAAIAAKAAAEALPIVERAYIFIIPELEFWDDLPHSSGVGTYASRIGVKFRLENHGKTPAAVQSISARLRVLNEPPDNKFHVIVSILPAERILISGESWVPDDSPVNCPIDEPTADTINDRTAAIWFYGSILYLDMFGTEHVTRFRWSWSTILEAFTARGDAPYNQRT